MKQIAAILIIFSLLSGCVPQQETPPIQDQDIIATFVAGTLTAEPHSIDPPDQPADTQASPEDGSPQPPTPSSTATDTPTPTLTLTPTVTDTPETVPGDPVLSLGSPTFKDTFSDGSNFYLYDEPQASYAVDDGKMVLTAKKANEYETWSLSWGDLTNFYLEITGTFGEECGGKDRYGMIFRAPDTSQGYLISISCDGSYRLSAWDSDDEEYTELKKWTGSGHINAGPGGTNRLGIKVKGTKLTGYINGHQVFEKTDSAFSKGRFGVLVAATDTPGFTAYLSQAVYWKLP
ncbi:MAG: hypothetical protein GQ562_02450 [Anaerolineales bacterium]|nr:hypothetical protein [Anaerolineales bacterium]